MALITCKFCGKQIMPPKIRTEHGNILLWAVMGITFLSGMAAWLQAMSDPALFQSDDTRMILNIGYTQASAENVWATLIQKDPDYPIDEKDGQAFRTKIAEIIGRYRTVNLNDAQGQPFASVRCENSVTPNAISPDEPAETVPENVEFEMDCRIKTIKAPTVNRTLTIQFPTQNESSLTPQI